ncbi:MAG: Phosphatidylglycerophosphate synthase [Candidatus Aminicenantes bacterium]|nr:Phosphatidylglycerophosphate synthase [Candidatus Aminicenantes bacterium]
MDSRNREKFWNAANLITLARVALVPVFALMLLRGRAFGSLAVIFLAGLSDVLDGWVARTWHQRTKVGTLIDPLADKLLLSTAYVLLSVRSLGFARVIPVWLTAAVIGRDFIILAGGAVIFLTRGRREFPPSILGKMSTIIQVATVFWVVLSNSVRVSALGRSSFLAAITSSPVLDGFYAVTLLLTAVSGAHYIYKGIRMAFPGGPARP